ncbi:VWA domain-containing protein [[Eubacterium] cellulosolvens]
MSRISVTLCIKAMLVIAILFFPLVPQYAHGQVGQVLTARTVTPNFVLPGETMTVNIRIDVTGGPIGTGVADVSLVLDRTGSMFGAKFAAAKQSAKIFIDLFELEDNKVQIIDFSEQSFVRKDFTFTDAAGKTELKQAIDMIPSPLGLTNLYGAFQKSAQEIADKGRPETFKAVVLLTDGRPTIGISTQSAFTALATDIAAEGGSVFTIGLGADVNSSLLQAIADAGNGEYLFAPTPEDLEELFRRVAEIIQSPPATNVRVTDKIPTNLVTYNNDASIEPNSTSGSPVDTINWNIDRIIANAFWEVNYTVTAQKRVVTTTTISPTSIIYDRAQAVDIRVDLPPGFAVREVATTSISQNATILTDGDVLQVNATVENLGTLSENFPVVLRVSRNSSTQSEQHEVVRTQINLANGSSTNVVLNWNTSGWGDETDPPRYGQWNISVMCDPDAQIFGDDPSNNTRVGETITLNPAGEGFPIWIIIIFLPFLIIPLIAATLLRKRKVAMVPVATARPIGTAACPICRRPVTYLPNYRKYYCPVCRRFL